MPACPVNTTLTGKKFALCSIWEKGPNTIPCANVGSSCNGRNISTQLRSQLSFSQPPAPPPDLQQPLLHTLLAPVHLTSNTSRLPTSEFHCSCPLLRCRGCSASPCFSFYWYQSFGKVRNVFLISLLRSEMKHSIILLNRLWNHVWFCGEELQRRPQIMLLHCFAVFLIFVLSCAGFVYCFNSGLETAAANFHSRLPPLRLSQDCAAVSTLCHGNSQKQLYY